MDRAGLRLGTLRVRITGFRPVARVPCFHSPLGQFRQVMVVNSHRPAGREKIAEGIQVVAEWEFNPVQDQRRLQGLLRRLLGKRTDMTWCRRKT